jgi:hypothetical protein
MVTAILNKFDRTEIYKEENYLGWQVISLHIPLAIFYSTAFPVFGTRREKINIDFPKV